MKKILKQLTFEKTKTFADFNDRVEHGGSTRIGKRKLYRPFNSKKAIHLVLRSTKAHGQWSMLKKRNENTISRLIYSSAAKNMINIHKFANSGNHLHVLLKAPSKKAFQKFLRTITGLIARHVMNARRGYAKGKFWNSLAYTKMILSMHQFKNTANYIWKNALEGWGIIPPRSQALGRVKINFLIDDWLQQNRIYDG
ncbi:MAG: transposase [Oligoflexia bacterium]|nr:transposase [Oligoflexia bacterium]